ncbi:MAG: CBS domain-containing protein [Limnohabitans sp.]|nr:CBS domain-containing protein [Limnohabitans sp.]
MSFVARTRFLRSARKAIPSALAAPALLGLRAVQTAVNVRQTLHEALADLRTRVIDHPVIYVYVIDDDDRLVGQLPIRELLFSDPSTPVHAVMKSELTTVTIDTSMEEALGIFAKSRLLALPVVDSEGRLVGAIDVEQYAREQLERAERERVRQVFQTLGLAVDHPEALSPMEGFRMRMPWLCCNIGGGLLCAIVAWLFGGLLAEVVLLAFFLPLVLTLGESIAMQSLAITVGTDPAKRTWATGLRALRVEASTAFLLAAVSGGVVALASLLWGGGVAGAITMFLAVVSSMLVASIAGGAIPMALHAFRLDPSVAAGPIALVVADTATTAMYFGLGLAFLMPTA